MDIVTKRRCVRGSVDCGVLKVAARSAETLSLSLHTQRAVATSNPRVEIQKDVGALCATNLGLPTVDEARDVFCLQTRADE